MRALGVAWNMSAGVAPSAALQATDLSNSLSTWYQLPMENRPNTRPAPGRRTSGPQGTQLFSKEELSQLASETGFTSDGKASVQKPVLQGVNAGLEGHRFALGIGRQTIGRHEGNDIVIHDPSVSSQHAWIMNQQGHYVIMNTLSTNGTFVNHDRVHEASIKHGDRIRFGQVEFVFLTRESSEGSGRSRMAWLAGFVTVVAIVAVAWWLL